MNGTPDRYRYRHAEDAHVLRWQDVQARRPVAARPLPAQRTTRLAPAPRPPEKRDRHIRRWSKRATWVVAIVGVVALLLGGGSYALFLGGASNPRPVSDINLQMGLVGHWKMDGNGKDSTPYGHNASVNNAMVAASDRKGDGNGAYSFNGTDSTFTIGSADVLNTRSETISFWAQVSQLPTDYTDFVQKQCGCGTSANPYIVSLQSDGTVHFSVGLGGGQTNEGVKTTSTIGGGRWHLITATRTEGSQLAIYVDGALEATAADTITTDTANSIAIHVGYENNGGNRRFYAGKMDDLRIYNRAINADEIKALYDSYDTQLSIGKGESKLKGWWKLDGNANDATPYGHNGTVSGARPTTDRRDRANSAYSFNGSGAYISFPANGGVISGDGVDPSTTSLWVKVGALPTSGSAVLLSHGYGGSSGGCVGAYGMNIKLNTDGSVTAETRGSGTVSAVTSTSSIADGQWHLIAMTVNHDPTNYGNVPFALYLDGALAGSGNTPNGWRINDYSVTFKIGGCSATTSFNGAIDDLRLYNDVLSVQQIGGLYNSYDAHISLGGSGQAGSVSLGKGLVGYWPMNGNARDATPYSDNGTSSATLTTDRKGRTNSAYYFDGGTQSIGIPQSATLNPTLAVTVSAWFRQDAGSSGYSPVVEGSGSLSSTYGYYLGTYPSSGQYFIFRVGTSNGGATAETDALTPGQWYHAVGVYSSETGVAQLYINGVLVASSTSVTQGGALTYLADPITIGRFDYCCTNYNLFKGSIDDVRIYNRALNSAEVQALYNQYN